MGKRKQKRGSKEGRCGRRRVRERREWAQSQGVLVASRSLKDKEADSPSCLQKADQPSQHLAFSPVRPVLDPEPTELCEQRVRDKDPGCLSPPLTWLLFQHWLLRGDKSISLRIRDSS